MTEIEPVSTIFSHDVRNRWVDGHTVIDRLIDEEIRPAGLQADDYYFAEVRRRSAHARLDTMLGIAGVSWEEKSAAADALARLEQESLDDIRDDRIAKRRRSLFRLIEGENTDNEEGDL